jgi:hypothetical protein
MNKKPWPWKPVHPSHEMTPARSEIRAPAGTPRFYGVRNCRRCGAEQAEHPAGRFMDAELRVRCEVRSTTPGRRGF